MIFNFYKKPLFHKPLGGETSKWKGVGVVLCFFVLFGIVNVGTVSAASISASSNTGLIGYWKLDEGAGTRANDSSGKKNTGTLVSSPAWITGKLGKALRFNGSTSYVDLGNGTIVNTSQPFSIVFWLKHVVTSDYVTVIRLKGVSEFGFNLGKNGNAGISGNSIHFGFRGNPPILSSNSSYFIDNNLNVWRQYIITYNGGAVGSASSYNVYVDGTSVSLTAGSGIGGATNTNIIGQDGGGGGTVNGLIDDVRVYNRALTATEIRTLYQSGSALLKPVNKTGLVAYFPMDEGFGTRAGDFSGKSITAYFSGTPAWVSGKIGKALQFDGSSNYVRNDNFSIGTDPIFTISAWVKRTASVNSKGVWGLGAGGVTGQTISTWNNVGEKIGIDLWSTATFYVNDDYPLNNWVHVTWVKTGPFFSTNTIKIYVNGVEKSLLVSRGSAGTDYAETLTNGFTIGGMYPAGPSYHIPAVIDDVRVYNRALSAAEIADLYRSGSSVGNANINNFLTNGLVGLWSFDGKDMSWATGKAYDRSGQGNDGSLSTFGTTTSVVTGKIGQALKFNGVNSVVALGTSNIIGTGSTPFSASMWVYPTENMASGDWYFPIRLKQDSQFFFSFYMAPSTSGVILPVFRGSTQWGTPYTLSTMLNKWNHAVVIYNGGDKSTASSYVTYINGVQIASGTNNYGGAGGSCNDNALGSDADASCVSNLGQFQGRLDDVHIYNRALSANEVKQLYNAGR